MHREITVTEMEVDAEIDDFRFTMESINPPVGTAVIDYDAHRGLGYWDGEGLSETPTKVRRKAMIADDDGPVDSRFGTVRAVMVWTGFLLILLVAVAAFRRRHQGS